MAKFNKLLAKARKKQSEFDTACCDLAVMLQPFFEEDIHILHQPSDGFVVLHNAFKDDKDANEPIEFVYHNIKTDRNFYKSI